MKLHLPHMIRATLLAAVATLAFPSFANAQLIYRTVYSDNFSGSGSVGSPSHHPTTTEATAAFGGVDNANWSTTGAVNLSGLGAIITGGGTKSAFLTLNVQEGAIYTLTASITPATAGKTTIGFANGTTFTDYLTVSGATSGTPRNPVLNGFTFGANNDTGTQLQPITLTLTLDTTGTDWVTTVTLSGTRGILNTPWSATSDYTFLGNPTITTIGFAATGALSGVQNFKLEAIPEPSSYALGLIALGVLAFAIHRRARLA